MAQIVLDQVDKVFSGGVKAVNDLSLEVPDGEFMVLVGPSGCGKSTALRIIAGLEDITRGTVQIGDQVVNNLPPKDRDIAMIFQNYALYPQMTVAQNMAFGLQMRKTPKREIARRVQDAAKILGLEPYLARKPAALSGGQRQRVAMGRAIVREPQAFLMDEPLSNLDAKLRVGMRASLAELHERLHVTTVYVTHDQVEAMTLGTRVCVLRDGKKRGRRSRCTRASRCGRRGSTPAAGSDLATASSSGWIPATCTSSTPTADSRSGSGKLQSRCTEDARSGQARSPARRVPGAASWWRYLPAATMQGAPATPPAPQYASHGESAGATGWGPAACRRSTFSLSAS